MWVGILSVSGVTVIFPVYFGIKLEFCGFLEIAIWCFGGTKQKIIGV